MSVKVGLLGHGTVGGAFAQLLAERADAIEALCGRRPEIIGTLTRSQGEFEEILAQSDVIVEVMGGVDPTKGYVLTALKAGKPVITANKQLLSRHGEELWQAARDADVYLGFEAAVAGVVPAIRVLRESLAGADIQRVLGIVNGTTNFILTEMARTGASYEEALGQAQKLGYAEADPTEDVNGCDAAAKMAILARLAFGSPVSIDQVKFDGIEYLTPEDISYAKELGLGLKLIGTAERVEGGIAVRVYPAFLYGGHPLASVSGPFNAVTVESDAITEITMSGPGAGGVQTASAILGDLVTALVAPQALPPAGPPIPVIDDVESAFYLHVEVADEPGVLAQITKIFADEGVSVKSVVQQGLSDDARLVMVLHQVLESKFFAAYAKIAALDVVRNTPRAIRVIEEEFV